MYESLSYTDALAAGFTKKDFQALPLYKPQSKVGEVLTATKAASAGAVKKKKEVKICDFCGPYETCDKKRHTRQFVEDLLVDSGICDNERAALDKWWVSTKKNDPGEPDSFGGTQSLLLGHSPYDIWPYYPNRVAKYVRAVM
jgi:hypothetical protein